MNEHEKEKEEPVFEIAVVIPRRNVQEKDDEGSDCVRVLVEELTRVGFIVERVFGIAEEFVKVGDCF